MTTERLGWILKAIERDRLTTKEAAFLSNIETIGAERLSQKKEKNLEWLFKTVQFRGFDEEIFSANLEREAKRAETSLGGRESIPEALDRGRSTRRGGREGKDAVCWEERMVAERCPKCGGGSAGGVLCDECISF